MSTQFSSYQATANDLFDRYISNVSYINSWSFRMCYLSSESYTDTFDMIMRLRFCLSYGCSKSVGSRLSVDIIL